MRSVMQKLGRCLILGAVMVAAATVSPCEANAQYAVPVTTVQPVVPAVVGYTAERRGLFGWRVVYRPIVAPVSAAVPVTVARPVLSAPVTMGYAPTAAPVTMGYAPAAAPVTMGYAPAAAPVTSYYAPPVAIPVAPPITTYRIPLPAVTPYIGY